MGRRAEARRVGDHQMEPGRARPRRARGVRALVRAGGHLLHPPRPGDAARARRGGGLAGQLQDRWLGLGGVPNIPRQRPEPDDLPRAGHGHADDDPSARAGRALPRQGLARARPVVRPRERAPADPGREDLGDHLRPRQRHPGVGEHGGLGPAPVLPRGLLERGGAGADGPPSPGAGRLHGARPDGEHAVGGRPRRIRRGLPGRRGRGL
mmetsp:Transcript_18044/g.46538  ORF Transcript_18044/g.46538 Transcript_18044/m.46538 type:complete len:209 (-) Transcript_18044:214-840(-)